MNQAARERLQELAALAQLHLIEEYSLEERLFESKETTDYFRKSAQKAVQPKMPSQPIPPKAPQTPSIAAPTIAKHAQPTLTAAESKPQQKLMPTENHTLPPPKKEVDAPAPSFSFAIERPSPPSQNNTSEWRKILTERHPHIAIQESVPVPMPFPPSSALAEAKAAVLILTYDTPAPQQEMLVNMGKAIEKLGCTVHTAYAPALEQEDRWAAFLPTQKWKLILSTQTGLSSLPKLQMHHQIAQKQARHTLGGSPLLLLADLSHYLQEPALKTPLWNAIKAALSSPA